MLTVGSSEVDPDRQSPRGTCQQISNFGGIYSRGFQLRFEISETRRPERISVTDLSRATCHQIQGFR
jgi:hypothetical protein